MIAVPIGPRSQRIITAAAPAYLDAHGRPTHPRDLLDHACLRLRFSSGARVTWEFERGNEVIRLDPPGPVLIQPGSACDLLVETAIAGLGIIRLFEDWLAPVVQSGALEGFSTNGTSRSRGRCSITPAAASFPLRSGPSSTSPGRSQPCQSRRDNDIGLHQGAVRGY